MVERRSAAHQAILIWKFFSSRNECEASFIYYDTSIEITSAYVNRDGCKFGKKKIKISVIKISDVEIKIEISDDGPGLPPKKMNEVFARGFRLDEQTPGTGLGLNIVKDIIEVYKGKVWLEKSRGLGGLQVNIRLPISIV